MIIKNISQSSDSSLNRLSLLTGLLIFVSPFLHFISINFLESAFHIRVFLPFFLLAITTIILLVVPTTFIVSRFLLHAEFYRLIPVFYAGFICIFLSIHVRNLLLIIGAPSVVRSVIYVIYAIFVVLLLWIIFRLSKIKEFYLVALVFALALNAVPLVQIANSAVISRDHGSIHSADYKGEGVVKLFKKSVSPIDLPNIYFIVPDSYTSVAVLHDTLSFDNKPFIQEMERRGFVHLPDSFSSYASTSLTLASLLQADYPITEDSPRYKTEEDFYPSLLYKFKPFQIVKEARHFGYTVSIISNYQTGNCGGPHVACDEGQSKFIPYEIQSFLEMTPLPRLLRKIKPRELLNDANSVDSIARTISYLSSANRPKSPYFMFIYHLPPHAPYVFEADCRIRSDVNLYLLDGNSSIPLYLDNLQCTNNKLIELTDYIAGVDPTAIIAIQADHGIGYSMKRAAGKHFKDLPENVSHDIIRDRKSVLSLVRVPDKCKKWLRPDLNSVNTVRFLFGCATGVEPAYLENRSYMSFYNDSPDYGLVYEVRR